jgi:formylmethanofuran dehydrogenase subunit E
MSHLQALLEETEQRHRHLCPRQVLGVRMGMYVATLFDLSLPQTDKRLIAFVETDGCFCDGLSVASGCWMGRRTMRLEDEGKIAATFVDTITKRTLRVRPRINVRQRAAEFAPNVSGRWQTQLVGYQHMPDDELFDVQMVQLRTPIDEIVSMPGKRTNCTRCGEEIINEREVMVAGRLLCRTCAGRGYTL